MSDPLAALTTLGISTIEELTALTSLFSHQQRPELPRVEQTNTYETHLSSQEEDDFRLWLVHEGIPFNPNDKFPDYDMRGYYITSKKSGGSLEYKGGHFPDTWKTPYHRSFSNESIYAPQDAPHWEGNKLVDRKGEVVYDEDDPEDLLPRAADKLINKDAATGITTGKRNVRPNIRPY